MTSEELENLSKLVRSKANFTEDNILDKSLEMSSIYFRYLELYTSEMKELKKFEADREMLYGTLFLDLKKNSNIEIKTKGDADTIIKANATYYNASLEVSHQETVVKYLEEVIDMYKKMTYMIGNIVSLIKIKRGLQ